MIRAAQRRLRAAVRRGLITLSQGVLSIPGKRQATARQLTRREAWAAHKAARRKRRKAETLLGRITGLPRSWRAYLTGWTVMHPAEETKAKRTPVRRKGDKQANRLAKQLADIRQVQANRVPRGRLTNPTALQ